MFRDTVHQKKQIEVIESIESSFKKNTTSLSMVEPVKDFSKDNRICLTSVHFPKASFLEKIQQEIIQPLKDISPEHFYYPNGSIHATIKNVKVINDPPLFSEQDVETTKEVFQQVIPQYKAFKIYYYRLLVFPYNLALVGTTDPELDEIILDLDSSLNKAGVPDDKKYLNDKYFFSNITLVRFNSPITEEFRKKINELSTNMKPFSYEVDSVTLLTGNATMMKLNKRGTWDLKK